MPDSILITGASGFMGPHVVSAFIASGHDVIACSQRGQGAEGTVALDLRDSTGTEEVIRRLRPSAVVNLAGVADPAEAAANPILAYDVNVLGQLRLITSILRHVPTARLVVLSSAEVYGHTDRVRLITEDAPLDPHTVYAATKAAAELQARQFHRSDNLDVVCLRIFGTLGPGRSVSYFPGRQVHQLAEILEGGVDPVVETFSLSGGRDFVDVRDVAAAIVAVVDRGRCGAVYNVATGKATPLRTVVERLVYVSGVAAEIRESSRPAPGRHSITTVGDPRRLMRDTGWQPTVTLDASLRDALGHVRGSDTDPLSSIEGADG